MSTEQNNLGKLILGGGISFGFAFKDASFKSSGTTVSRVVPEKKLLNFAILRCVNGAK